MIATLTQQETAMTDLFKNLTPKTSNIQASNEARQLSLDELATVAGGTKTAPPSGASEGCGFTPLPGHRDPRAF